MIQALSLVSLFLVAAVAGINNSTSKGDDRQDSTREPECKHSTYTSQIIEAARHEDSMPFEAGNRTFMIRLNVSSTLEPLPPESDVGRPFNLTGTIHFVEGEEEERSYQFFGYVICDFFTGTLQGPRDGPLQLGERPDPRPHDPAIVEDSAERPQGDDPPDVR